MVQVPDYVVIQEELQTLIVGGVPEFAHVFIEGAEEEVGNLSNMPLANIRLTETVDELVRLPSGYNEQATLLVDIIAFDFTSYLSAARLRGALLASTRRLLLTNREFSSQILTSQLSGNTTFGAYGVENNSGSVAMATLTVTCELDIEA